MTLFQSALQRIFLYSLSPLNFSDETAGICLSTPTAQRTLIGLLSRTCSLSFLQQSCCISLVVLGVVVLEGSCHSVAYQSKDHFSSRHRKAGEERQRDMERGRRGTSPPKQPCVVSVTFTNITSSFWKHSK